MADIYITTKGELIEATAISLFNNCVNRTRKNNGDWMDVKPITRNRWRNKAIEKLKENGGIENE